MKSIIILSFVLLLTGCHISRGFQPPPEGYKGYYKKRYNDVPPEIIKRDMLNCGFPNVYNNNEFNNNNPNASLQAEICMEELGYNVTDGRGKICSGRSFVNEEPCQKYLNRK